jgi:glycosyltransferase involved in cell wall biosynthesis
MVVVVSAINIFHGGPLTIVREFLRELGRARTPDGKAVEVTLFCHSAELYQGIVSDSVKLVEKPLSRRSWFIRLLYEYVWFWFWSCHRQVDCWISLHDITPNVRARRRYVYCHNPAPFYSGKALWKYEPSFELFRLFYKYLYKCNIHKNDGVIVQQQWLRKVFIDKFGLNPSKVIVALPEVAKPDSIADEPRRQGARQFKTIIYPAVPRPFKNFEVLLEAMALMEPRALRLVLTISGDENRYARALRARCHQLSNVELAGYLNRAGLLHLYQRADGMVFSSKLETWGLPLSEFKQFQKPIFAADLPYAREALGGYKKAVFFCPENHRELAMHLKTFVEGKIVEAGYSPATQYEPPFARNWGELIKLLGLVSAHEGNTP